MDWLKYSRQQKESLDKEIRKEFQRQSFVEFGEWLMTQGLIPADPDPEWRRDCNIGLYEKVWESNDADWLTMEGHYTKWLMELRDKAKEAVEKWPTNKD